MYRKLMPGPAFAPGAATTEHRRRRTTMKLTILGATGATGTFLVGQALAAGHDVTAVVRDPARLAVPAPPRPRRPAPAAVMAPPSIRPVLAGAAPEISGLGPRRTGPTTVIQDSVRSI